jgi:hypothetical protein
MTLSLGVKRPGRETDHSPLSSAEVNNAWSYTSTLTQYAFMAWCSVKKPILRCEIVSKTTEVSARMADFRAKIEN